VEMKMLVVIWEGIRILIGTLIGTSSSVCNP
jgi:hypothetical protein